MPFPSALSSIVDTILGDALAPYALFSQQGRMIGEIAIDVPIREVHDDSFVITQHPVESGTPVADHYFRNPAQCEMTCGFSDSTAGYQGYVQQVYQAFQDLAATREPFDVSTGKRQYSKMMIADLAVITDPQSEYALFITVRLQEVIITQTSGGDAGPQGTPDNQANPASTGTTTDDGPQVTLPYEVTEGVETNAPLPPERPSGIGINSNATPVTTPAGSGGIGSA